MITVRTSPQYVNRVRQDWTANGGVYGDGGISALVPSNDPFAQLGATLDLTFAGVPTDQLTAPTTDGYSINLNLSSEIYQIAAQYAVWQSGVGMASVNFADIVTFTRASTGTYFNSAGTLTSAAINEARFDYNPSTLAPQGLLIEESRTNSIRNNTMQGAAAGTPGTLPTNWSVFAASGLTTTVVSTGTSNGITYIDLRFSGTSTATFYVIAFDALAVAASVGQNWTESFWVSLIGGSLTNINAVNFSIRWSGGPAASDIAFSPTATFTRLSAAATAPVSTTGVTPALFLSMVNGAAIDITLRIGLPQLELGAFATSVIPTTTTALTRSQDRAVVNTLAPWFNSVAGTIYAEFAVTQPASGGNQFLARFSDNSYNNQIGDFINTTGFVGISTASGGVFDGLAATAVIVSANTTTKAVGAYATNDLAAVKDGGAVATDTTATIPSGMTRFDLGSDHSGLNNIKAGYLRRITYYPRRLSNADLQTITA